MQLSATEVRVLSRLIERTLALPPEQREAYLAGLPGPQQALVPRIRERLAQLAQTEAEAEVAVAPPPPRAQRPEVRVGPYRLLEPLSGDEQGRVWRAERGEGPARRWVALRLPPLADAAHPPDPRQQAAERQVVRLAEHPQVLRLIDAGIDAEGRFYRVLPYVEGLGLVAHAQRRGLGLQGVVALFLQACRLLALVHEAEVACTALGTSSFRVDDEGRVLLLDWGRGRSLRPDTRAADIQALGRVLQALLQGQDDEATPAPALQTGVAAPPPAKAKPVAPGPDVAHVLRRALRVEDTPPYPSVLSLIDDLNLVLGWQPVPGAGGDALHRVRLWLRRHRLRLGLGALAAAVVLGMAWAGWKAWQRGQGQSQRADAARLFLQQELPEALPGAAPAGSAPLDLAVEAPRLQQALEKARTGFDGQPVLRGQVITALGVRFRALGQPEQALTVLQEAATLLQGTARADDPALGLARAELALQWQQEGSAAGRERARALAQQVLQNCTGSACAGARALAQRVQQSP
ncbi:hypothetical protein D621_06090 [beta proteobacterium AAP51]|nr:hypothetical protein D621_06090 [beta proteobacterium AAP51]